jgi:hypothetical protein
MARGGSCRLWSLAAAALVLATAVVCPAALHPAHRLASRVGRAVGGVVDTALLGLLFYGVITPVAVVMRLRGRDLLGLSFDRRRTSYWEEVTPVHGPEGMRRRF